MAGFSRGRLFKYYTLKLKAFLLSKDVLSFLVFVLLSATFWFVNALNKERELSIKIPIEYKGFSKDLMFVQQLPDHVQVTVKDLGVNLWKYVGKKPGPVVVVFNQKVTEKGLFDYTYSELLSKVSETLLPSSGILSMSPDHIKSKFIRLHSKVLPVELNSSITLEDQFMLSKPLEISPTEVEVFGPQEVIDTMEVIVTEMLKIEKLKDTLVVPIALQPIQSVTYAINQIEVRAFSEMFTEKTVLLPVQIINSPSHLTVIPFPAEIKTVFNISVKKFKDFDNNDIQLLIDFKEIKKGALTKGRLEVINNKAYITNIRLYPEEVEFLLEEKQ